MPKPSTELEPTSSEVTVVDRWTGEVISVRDAETEALAEFITNQRELRDELGDAEAVVSGELLARLDRGASWTVRVGDPRDRQWEITAPSPAAGSTDYPTDVLESELRALIEQDIITEGAAAKALKRRVVVALNVPISLNLKDVVGEINGSTFAYGGVELEFTGAEGSVSANKVGIKALEKVPGAKAALDRAGVPVPVDKRKVKVVEKVRDST